MCLNRLFGYASKVLYDLFSGFPQKKNWHHKYTGCEYDTKSYSSHGSGVLVVCYREKNSSKWAQDYWEMNKGDVEISGIHSGAS
jgi:hypothetical protein